MPEPEIARRCTSCGVSIRVRASFCPQCGEALPPKPQPATEDDDDTPTLVSGTPELIVDPSRSAATQPLNSGETSLPSAAVSPTSARRRQPKQATVGMVHRPGPPPREMHGEDGLNRVEKFRQISSAVIDEAAYDPSLRFILVAAVLFVVFLFLLLLSELI